MPVLEASEWVCCHFVKILPIWSPEETAEWRLKVQNDPGQLLELCRCLLTVSYSSVLILHLLQISWGNSRFVGFIWVEWLAHSYQPAGDSSQERNTEVGQLKPMKDFDPYTENWALWFWNGFWQVWHNLLHCSARWNTLCTSGSDRGRTFKAKLFLPKFI